MAIAAFAGYFVHLATSSSCKHGLVIYEGNLTPQYNFQRRAGAGRSAPSMLDFEKDPGLLVRVFVGRLAGILRVHGGRGWCCIAHPVYRYPPIRNGTIMPRRGLRSYGWMGRCVPAWYLHQLSIYLRVHFDVRIEERGETTKITSTSEAHS